MTITPTSNKRPASESMNSPLKQAANSPINRMPLDLLESICGFLHDVELAKLKEMNSLFKNTVDIVVNSRDYRSKIASEFNYLGKYIEAAGLGRRDQLFRIYGQLSVLKKLTFPTFRLDPRIDGECVLEKADHLDCDLVFPLLVAHVKPLARFMYPNRLLGIACARGSIRLAGAALDLGAEVNYERVQVPLHVAAGKGHLPLMNFLIDQGADINQINSDGDKTALSEAAQYGHIETMQYLLDRQAEVNPKLKSRFFHNAMSPTDLALHYRNQNPNLTADRDPYALLRKHGGVCTFFSEHSMPHE